MSAWYILSAACLIYGIQLMGKIPTARKGNWISSLGMLLAVSTTLWNDPPKNAFLLILVVSLGILVGVRMAVRTQMTAMPELVALFNGFGSLSSLFIGLVEGLRYVEFPELYSSETVWWVQASASAAMIIGGIAFTGSLIAYGKLSRKIPSGSIHFLLQKHCCWGVLLLLFLLAADWIVDDDPYHVMYLAKIVLFSLIGGVILTLHIGGGDMPVLISLLNSLSGIAACAAGMISLNEVLIVAGCLVGMSGLVLTIVMCKAMNRSLWKVLLSGLKMQEEKAQKRSLGEPKSMSVEEAYYPLEAARSVAIVPGYGLAVAQAQHAVKELAQKLTANGAEVFYAIHPVAGRMPGHMNVLLSEADVDYDQLVALESANARFSETDVAIVVGANDVVNPAAVENPNSPLYGMPVLEVFKARTVLVLKRGQGKGFSGLENELFLKENTRMIYGDAKKTLMQLAAEFKGDG